MLLAFVVVFFVLAKFGFPVITGMVDKRKQFIDESLVNAHKANERLAQVEQEGESILHDAREKESSILKEAAETREAIVEKAHQKAQEDSARLLSDAKAEIANEKQNALREIRSDVSMLSVKIAEQILREKLSTNEKQMELIDKMLDNVSPEVNKG